MDIDPNAYTPIIDIHTEAWQNTKNYWEKLAIKTGSVAVLILLTLVTVGSILFNKDKTKPEFILLTGLFATSVVSIATFALCLIKFIALFYAPPRSQIQMID